MGRVLGREPGGIFGLLEFHDEHQEAVERDLIVLGLRWRDVGTKALTWRDLSAIVTAAQPGSAIYRALTAEGSGWTATEYILADVYDAIERVRFYTAGAAGIKRPRKPKPYPRPGVTAKDRDVRTFRTTPMPIDEMRAWLGWDTPNAEHSTALTVYDPYLAALAAR